MSEIREREISTAEDAAPYAVRAFWVRMPRAGSHVNYSARCPSCGSRSRFAGGRWWCWCAATTGPLRFTGDALPADPPKPPLTARQIRNRVTF